MARRRARRAADARRGRDAGRRSSPRRAAFDPVAHPAAAKRRRDLVLKAMLDQGYITPSRVPRRRSLRAIPARRRPTPPFDDSKAPYFTSLGAPAARRPATARGRAFEGGLQVRTTLDLELQQAAEQAVDQLLSEPGGPTAALVAIDNDTGEVRAMVGGADYVTIAAPFNLATQGQRQPGSAFKPFVLARGAQAGHPARLRRGRRASTTSPCPGPTARRSSRSTTTRTTTSASRRSPTRLTTLRQLGLRRGRHQDRLQEHRHDRATAMGIRTPVSTNPAIALGGLGGKGVTVLDMAHAYGTLASGGKRVDRLARRVA